MTSLTSTWTFQAREKRRERERERETESHRQRHTDIQRESLDYGTRGKEQGQLYLPKCKTTQGQFSISFMGVKIWNSIPYDLRGIRSKNAFQKGLTKHLNTLS